MEPSFKENSRSHAAKLDAEDPLKHLRAEFIIPTKADLKRRTLNTSGIASLTLANHGPEHLLAASNSDTGKESCIYLCGNSLGLQPRRTTDRIASHLSAWATKGVFGHFTEHDDSPLAPFLHVDGQAAKLMAPIVGALPDEVAVMETLTANLHLMMSSFYRPTKEKHKIIIEGKAFPSDHYAVESQITLHGFHPEDALILIEPENPKVATLTTSHVLSVIDQHASSTALILLPGVQYYTGQYLDIKTITAHAHSLGVVIGWDLAHAVGNVDLHLHDWNVDFAAWCNYKYINSGPGAVAGLFVHSKHGNVDTSAVKEGKEGFKTRLCGWWGGDKAIRFEMGNRFVPIPGAQGFQVGNPSALAVTAVIASLEIFGLTTVAALRKKSVALTQYLEHLLVDAPAQKRPYHIITPSNPDERGAQLSVRLQPGLLEPVMEGLEDAGVVVDERKPDVIRVAPAPLYNTFTDVWDFVDIFSAICLKAQTNDIQSEQDCIGMSGTNEKGWAAIK